VFQCSNVLFDLEENLKQEIRIKLQMKGVNMDNVDLNTDDLSAYELESRFVLLWKWKRDFYLPQ